MNSPTVLIIDDEPDVVTYLGAVIADHGWNVRSASNARDGLAMARRHPPDVILLDLMMPERGGMSTLVEIRRDPDIGRLPVVFVTGIQDHLNRDFDAYLRRFRHIQPDAYLEKPVAPERLISVLEDLVAAAVS